jgi:hypothetical protein
MPTTKVYFFHKNIECDKIIHSNKCFGDPYLILGERENKFLCAPLKLDNERLSENNFKMNLKLTSFNYFNKEFHIEEINALQTSYPKHTMNALSKKLTEFTLNAHINLHEVQLRNKEQFVVNLEEADPNYIFDESEFFKKFLETKNKTILLLNRYHTLLAEYLNSNQLTDQQKETTIRYIESCEMEKAKILKLINSIANDSKFKNHINDIFFNYEPEQHDNKLDINGKIAIEMLIENESEYSKYLTPEQFEESPLVKILRTGSPFIKENEKIKGTFAEKLKESYSKVFLKD